MIISIHPMVIKLIFVTFCSMLIGDALVSMTFSQSNTNIKVNEELGNFHDCTDIEVDYQNDTTLTRAEIIARMDKALYLSLTKFDYCQDAHDRAGESGGGGGASNGASGPSEDVGGASSSGGIGVNSVAASDMSGTEVHMRPKSSLEQGGNFSKSSKTSGDSEGEGLADKQGLPEVHQASVNSNGKVPEDIPSVDNDSVLEAQIRLAAVNEKDPEIRAKLWNEYRKYKGLPIKK